MLQSNVYTFNQGKDVLKKKRYQQNILCEVQKVISFFNPTHMNLSLHFVLEYSDLKFWFCRTS